MTTTFTAKAETIIPAEIFTVWEALTTPALVQQWLFGTDMEVSAWEVGGSIRYKGTWEGKPYEDKGTILAIERPNKLVSTYWSSFSGLPDAPENYQKVTYKLSPQHNGTHIIITQEGNKTIDAAKHSEGNWAQVLQSMKNMLEKQ